MVEQEISQDKEFSIDFKALWKVIKKEKLLIISSAFICAIIAAVIVFKKPNEFTSVVSVMPELDASSTGGLSKFAGLASLAGVDLSNISSSDAIRPDLYPSIINNTSFYLYLLSQKVKTSEGRVISFKDFYNTYYDIDIDSSKKGLSDKIRSLLGIKIRPIKVEKNSKLVYLSKVDGEITEELTKKIIADMDKKTGIISISVELPDPLTAAYVAQISMNYLTSFVTNYRTEKSRLDLNFIEKQMTEAKEKFYRIQNKKAKYSDQFQAATIRLQSADVARERIESDYRVSSTFYAQLLQQYETAKMKVQEQTPVFKMLQNPIIPYDKSRPRRSLIILFFTSFGVGIGSVIAMLRNNNYKMVLK